MLTSRIESILFIAAKPMSVKKLAELLEAERTEVDKALDELAAHYNESSRGIRLMRHGGEVQLSTAPDNSKVIQDFIKDETTGELTKPSLEALTIVAYRGPVSKAELEQIRGVNCSLILRNLLMRGLIEVEGEAGQPQARYRVTLDFLRFLGVASVEELPDYEKLRSHENVVKILQIEQTQTAAAAVEPAVADAVADQEPVAVPVSDLPPEESSASETLVANT
ncbi:MAG: SMC-Scp complex subunit ScpB [Patescibacteria group bacterium]|jgi:segregation and condensation protein B